MQYKIPATSLIILVGASSSGKSTFAKTHFKNTEILSSDFFRAMVSNSEDAMDANVETFEALHFVLSKRLQRNLLTVVDATNLHTPARKALKSIALEYHVLPIILAFDVPEKILLERHRQRQDRNFGENVILQHHRLLKQSLKKFKEEGFRQVILFKTLEELQAAEFVRTPIYSDKREEKFPFDIIGDVHGCFDELQLLLEKLGYQIQKHENLLFPHFGFSVTNPENRKAFFVGDLVDRGNKIPEVLRLVMSMVYQNQALCVAGNHDEKLLKKLRGKNVTVAHGMQESLDQLANESPEFIEEVKRFLDGLISHYVVDEGNLVVAYAGLKENMQGRASGAVRSFCLFGETTGEIDEFGLPVRYNWALEYKGKATVVYGHTPVLRTEWLNNTIDIDTGCVFGGKLTALRYPEREFIQVDALKTYAESKKPLNFIDSPLSLQQENDDILDIADLIQEKSPNKNISTKYGFSVNIAQNNMLAALEVMSRFAINPKWLIYLPPTMSPTESSQLDNYLEHPTEAFQYFAKNGIKTLVCEEKHMGSRAIIVICKNEKVVLDRFGIEQEGIGVCYTRTGRSFFTDKELEQAFLSRLNIALEKSGFYEKHQTDWVCLDCELMPWSAKAQSLIQNQYAAVGSSAKNAIDETLIILEKSSERFKESNPENYQEMTGIQEIFANKKRMISDYIQSYQNYCWEVNDLDDYTLAPFHILATENAVHTDKPHTWHLEEIATFCKEDEKMLLATNHLLVDLNDDNSRNQAIDWWEKMTQKGGEGMVVKPLDFISKNSKGIIQPAIKCRGSAYLSIIYGAEYNAPQNLIRLKQRSVHKKRNLALNEFVLGLTALDNFVQKQPLHKVHECVFGVLALESEPIDPRL